MDLSEFTADQFHIVPTEAVKPGRLYGGTGDPGEVALATDDDRWVLRVYSKHQRGLTNFALHFRNAALGTRLVFQGPIVHEDYANMIALPTVIALHQGPVPVVRDAKVGDIVIFANHIWQIREDKALHDPYLALVS